MNPNDEMKENRRERNLLCRVCPNKETCSLEPNAAFMLDGSGSAEPREPEKSQDKADAQALQEMNDALNDLVDCLFSLIDKIAQARQFLDRLDAFADAFLDYLSSMGVSELTQED